jgi:hypothetical protein
LDLRGQVAPLITDVPPSKPVLEKMVARGHAEAGSQAACQFVCWQYFAMFIFSSAAKFTDMVFWSVGRFQSGHRIPVVLSA